MTRGLVCAKDLKFLRIKKNGVWIEEGMPNGSMISTSSDGRVRSEAWQSYKLWIADLYECPECGFELVTGFGACPVVEHYEPKYQDFLDAHPPIGRVDDCGGARP